MASSDNIFIDLVVHGGLPLIEWAMEHFARSNPTFVLTYVGWRENELFKMLRTNYVPYCVKHQVKYTDVIPYPCNYEQGLEKLITHHGMNKFVARDENMIAYSRIISGVVQRNPSLSCEVWFVHGANKYTACFFRG